MASEKLMDLMAEVICEHVKNIDDIQGFRWGNGKDSAAFKVYMNEQLFYMSGKYYCRDHSAHHLFTIFFWKSFKNL